MKPFNVFIVVSLVVIAIGFLFFRNGSSTSQNSGNSNSNSEVSMDRLNYIDYSEQSLESAKINGKPVLFFAATLWCQTCIQLDKEIKERVGSLPSDVTILKVDYDNDREMKRKWGVTVQHTLIRLDGNGNEVKRWVGGNFDALVQNLQ